MNNPYEYGQTSDDLGLAPYLTPQEIIDLLGIGKNTMYSLLNSGSLKGFRAGKQWRVARREFERFCGKG